MASDREFSWRRCTAWTVAIGLHALILVPMSVPLRLDTSQSVVESVTPSWSDRERYVPILPSTPIEQPIPRINAATAPASARSRSERRRERRALEVAEDAVDTTDFEVGAARQEAPIARPLIFLDDDARAKLPDEPMFAVGPPAREGDWYTPGDGSEDDVFYRPLALEPNTTSFARVWRPPQSVGSDVYERLLRATTGVVRIPLNPKFTLVCGASLAGLGGGCGIARVTGTGVIVERPPEAPWDRANRAQCRELRDQLDAAESADEVAFLLDRLTALCTGNDAEAGRGL